MNEKLSALMDGELARDEAQGVIKKLGSDYTQRESWGAYHLIGACLRGDAIGNAGSKASPRNTCTEAIFARLAAEPTVLAPASIRKPSRVESRTRMALAMAASVVTVSAVGVVAFKQQQGATVAPVSLVQQVAPQPVADASLQRAQADLRVNDYLVVHRQFANPGAFQAATLNQPRDVARDTADAARRAAVR
ncbi:MAG: sigma-E factor negative regulatory protein [Betaproteobacteria bacterium]|nr:sigma-E factor negative regulatory protein [Betaproteobacteria bacterium]